MVFGLQTQPKSWLTGYTFWVNHYLEIVFSKISVVTGEPPPLNDKSIYIYAVNTIYIYILHTLNCYDFNCYVYNLCLFW